MWRWHFYAGLFTVPFILWLSVTGGIYLFKPQIQALIDRPYNDLALERQPLPPSALITAAQSAVPGSVLHRYVLPAADNDARQILVGEGAQQTRVYVHPATGAILKQVEEQSRFLRLVFHLHGELLAGRWGSMLVELAASWAIVMLLTGLFLWWPRQTTRLAGVLYPRLQRRGRIFWRDMHAVTGVWVSLFAIILILSGLPWAKNWGSYFNAVRSLTGTASVSQEWSRGSAAEAELRSRLDTGARAALATDGSAPTSGKASSVRIDRMIAKAGTLGLAPPVEISPPADGKRYWLVKSQTANRPQRSSVEMDPTTGRVMGRRDFADGHWIDRTVGYGIALHEGAFWGLANQLFNLVVLLGLVVLSVSSVVLWLRRRPQKQLGAPEPKGRRPRSVMLVIAVLALVVLVPLFGASLACVLMVERLLLGRWKSARRFLSLRNVARG
ncbi:PepSY-associated TM helix family protein [Salinisphaera dokdonensis CL-ES53]|uniref:PepSY-associated TM helix family protein n=1 Tax=Salinisphaera dokdonensis CL-ES53 TaxID=1304272 RepID=A0ABV2AWX0_9GAMM